MFSLIIQTDRNYLNTRKLQFSLSYAVEIQHDRIQGPNQYNTVIFIFFFHQRIYRVVQSEEGEEKGTYVEPHISILSQATAMRIVCVFLISRELSPILPLCGVGSASRFFEHHGLCVLFSQWVCLIGEIIIPG